MITIIPCIWFLNVICFYNTKLCNIIILLLQYVELVNIVTELHSSSSWYWNKNRSCVDCFVRLLDVPWRQRSCRKKAQRNWWRRWELTGTWCVLVGEANWRYECMRSGIILILRKQRVEKVRELAVSYTVVHVLHKSSVFALIRRRVARLKQCRVDSSEINLSRWIRATPPVLRGLMPFRVAPASSFTEAGA